jgi:hypothetical protein
MSKDYILLKYNKAAGLSARDIGNFFLGLESLYQETRIDKKQKILIYLNQFHIYQ